MAEMLHSPVREVCEYNMWGRCEASRPGNIAVSGRVSEDWRRSGKGGKRTLSFSYLYGHSSLISSGSVMARPVTSAPSVA